MAIAQPARPPATAEELAAQQQQEVHNAVSEMLDLAHVLHPDPERPTFHVSSRRGWINDPNGPLMYRGKYHLFYQHVVNSCEWAFGLVWGHAVSSDLVHWEHLPPALMPTPASGDADGCFSGCALLDADGKPMILYTGVRLRSNPECGPLPPLEQDLQLPFIEQQFAAVPVEGDDLLRVWQKAEKPIIDLPPANLPLVGWRDPFIFEAGGEGREWGMLMGTGLKGKGGAVMIYRSTDLNQGWRFDGMLCEADNADAGLMWECPILLQLNRIPEHSPMVRGMHAFPTSGASDPLRFQAAGAVAAASATDSPEGALVDGAGLLPTADTFISSPKSLLSLDMDMDASSVDSYGRVLGEEVSSSSQFTHLFCVSPDAPTNPVLYWVGQYDVSASRFMLDGAKGPFRMDLGDVMYAPNMMTDDQGRHLFWGWLQERRRMGTYDYSGCLSLPRMLRLRGDTLVQEPAPEVTKLRKEECWRASDLTVSPEKGTPVDVVGGQAVEIELTLQRGESTAAGVHFRSWRADSEHAAVIVDWERAHLEVVFSEGPAEDLLEAFELAPPPDAMEGPIIPPAANIGPVIAEPAVADTAAAADLIAELEGANTPTAAAAAAAAATFDEAAAEPTPAPAGPRQRRVGGPINLKPGQDITLRVFVDHSCIEVYASTGEVLSTRVYRGQPPRAAEAGIDLVSYGGPAAVASIQAWEMSTIWQADLMAAQENVAAQQRALHAAMLQAAPSIALSSLDGDTGESEEEREEVSSGADRVSVGTSLLSIPVPATSAAAAAATVSAPDYDDDLMERMSDTEEDSNATAYPPPQQPSRMPAGPGSAVVHEMSRLKVGEVSTY